MSTCTTCDDHGYVRSGRMSPEATCDLEECPACHGESDGALDPDAALEADTPLGLSDDDGDGEPPDLDGDAGYDPYTGGPEDDGFDTGHDDYCDDF
jgi:hypothetical protein